MRSWLPLLVLGLGCAPPPPPPPGLVLVGAYELVPSATGLRRRYAEAPVIRVDGATEDLSLRAAGAQLPAAVQADGARRWLRPTAWPPPGRGGALEVWRPDAPLQRWAIAWGPPLEALPPEDPLGAVGARLAAARASGTPEAWQAVAAFAAAAGLPTVASRAHRAAAWHALWAFDFEGAEAQLAAAEGLERAHADGPGQARQQLYRGTAARLRGDLRAAEDHLRAATAAAQRQGLERLAVSAASDLALVLAQAGRAAAGLRALEAEAARVARLGDRDRATWHVNRGWVGLLARQQGAGPELASIAADLEAGRALHAARKDPSRAANATLNLALVACEAGDLAGAIRRLAEAQALGLGDNAEAERFAALLQGQIKLRQGDLAAARAAFTPLVALEAAAPDAAWQARAGLSAVAEAEGRPGLAVAEGEAALAARGRALARLALTRQRAPFLGAGQALVDRVARLRLAAGDAAGAFAVLDGQRGALTRGLSPTAATDPAAVAAWRRARAAFDAGRRGGELLSDAARLAWQARRAAEGAALSRRFDTLVTAPPPPALTDWAAVVAALEPGAALLAFAALDGARLVFRLDPAGVSVRRLEAEPLAALPLQPTDRHLYLVPGDLAWAQALPTAGPAPLQLRHSLSRLPFAGLLPQLGPAPEGPPLLVIDPRQDLPGARREGRALAARFPTARRLEGPAATPEAVAAGARGAAWLHFAGHGELAPADPWRAWLALAGEQRWTLMDVLAAELPVGRVVLSGCKTGALGDAGSGRGLGLPEAFLVAGARSVLATHRPVDDARAAALIEAFYAAGGDRAPGQALRAAAASTRAAGDDETWRAYYLAGRP